MKKYLKKLKKELQIKNRIYNYMAVSKEILNSHPVGTLKKEIAKTNIKGYSKMKKAELVDLMMKNKEKFGHIRKKGEAPAKEPRTLKKGFGIRRLPKPDKAIALPAPPSMKGKKARKPRGLKGLALSKFKNTKKGAEYVLSLIPDTKRRDKYKIDVERGGKHGEIDFYGNGVERYKINLDKVGKVLAKIQKEDVDDDDRYYVKEIQKTAELVSGLNWFNQLQRDKVKEFLLSKNPSLVGNPIEARFIKGSVPKNHNEFSIKSDVVIATWNGYAPPLYYKNYEYSGNAPNSLYVKKD